MIAFDDSTFDKIQREIKLMEKLNHPNIINLIDSKEENNVISLLLEYAEGNLFDMISKKFNKKEYFEEKDILKIFYGIVKAVYYLHSQNPPIIHRDIKIENILVKNNQYVLCDFGSKYDNLINKVVQQEYII